MYHIRISATISLRLALEFMEDFDSTDAND